MILWIWTTYRGYRSARDGDFAEHQAWVAANAYAPVPFLCWLPNIVVAEYIIRRRRLPSLIRTPIVKAGGISAR